MKNAVLITGAAAGTGLAIAERFAREGYAVFISSRRKEAAEEAAKGLRAKYGCSAFGVKLEPEADGDIDAAFQALEDSDCYLGALVLNAADLGLDMPMLTVDAEEWMRVISTNLGWNFRIVQRAARIMTEKGGTVVFIGSNTSTRAIKNRSAYIASKGGINSLTKALAVELGEYGIRVNCVAAGSIKTVRWDAISPEAQEAKKQRVPIGDIAEFEDIANAAWFLSSEASRNITGAILNVDGGADAQLFPNV